MLRSALSSLVLIAIGTTWSVIATAGTTTNSFAVNQQIPANSSQGYYVSIAGVPSGAVITNVAARFDYIAYDVVQDYVSVRFHRGSDPGPFGGQVLVAQETLSEGNPGSTSYSSFSTWNGQDPNTQYWFHFSTAFGSPLDPTIQTIYVEVTWGLPPPPAAPALLTPADFHVRTNQTPHDSDWTPVSGATLYRIYVDNNIGFGTPEINVETAASQLTSFTTLADNVYFWRVQARDALGQWGSWSTTRQFVVDTPPPAPTLASPAAGAVLTAGQSTPFSWSGPSGYSIDRHYLRIVAGADLNATPQFDEETTAGTRTIDLSGWAPGTYTWGVRAMKNHPAGYNQSTYETTIRWGGYSTRQFDIQAGPFDLSIAVDAPSPNANVQRGNSHLISGTVSLAGGPLPLSGQYVRIYVYLSQSANSFTAGDLLVVGDPEALDIARALLDDGTETFQASIAIPTDVEGPFYVHAVVDGPDFWSETNESNNVGSSASTIAIWRPGAPAPDAGDLARTWDDADVHWIRYGKKWHVLGSAFSGLGYLDADVQWYGSGALSGFATGNEILQDDDDFVYRRDSVATVFRIQGGQSRPFLNEAAFEENGFAAADVYRASEVGLTWIQSQYPVGPAIESTATVLPDFAPLYRLYDDTPGARDHFYTTSLDERTAAEAAGYLFERVEGYVSRTPFTGGVTLYRLYDSSAKSHFYTAVVAERDAKLVAGYADEGVAGYVYASPVEGSVPLVRLHESGTGHYFLASRQTEYLAVLIDQVFGGAWQIDQSGNAGFISPSGLKNPLGHVRQQARAAGVGSATGAFEHALEGIRYHGYGPTVDFRLLYNSQSLADGPLSPGWGHPYRTYITEGSAITGEPTVVVTWGNGRETTYVWNATEATYESVPANYTTLTEAPTNAGYNLTMRDQTRYEFRRYNVNDPTAPVDTPEIRLIAVEDRHGNRVVVSRQASTARIDWIDDTGGRRLTFTYDDPANPFRLVGVSDPALGRTLAFGYDANGRLSTYTNARGGVTQLAYDAEGRLATVTYPLGVGRRTLQMTYDAEGRVATSSGRCDRRVMHFEYGGAANPVPTSMSILDSANTVTLAEFANHAAQLCLSEVHDATSPTPSTIECVDPDHPTLPTRVVDFRGNSTDYTYDANGNVASITNEEGNTATFTHDPSNNNLLSVTDFGSPTRTTVFGWSLSGTTLETVTDPNNLVTEYDWNARGQLTHARDPLTHQTVYTYGADGNLDQITDPLSNTSNFVHGAAGRLSSITDAENRSRQYLYDLNDNVTRVTDDLGHQKHLTYDLNENLTGMSYLRGGVQDTVAYTYDANECLASVQDPNGGILSYAYDSEGRVQSRTDARLQVTHYTYDANSRLDTVTYVGTPDSVSFEYDENGNMTEVDESWLGPAQLFAYDALDRLESHTNAYGQTVTYAYDDASNPLSVTYQGPAGARTVSYGHDLGNRLESIQDWTGGLVGYDFDDASNLSSETHPNGISTQYGHDLASRLMSIVHRKTDASVVGSYIFSLDGVGNHQAVTGVDPLPVPDPAIGDVTYTIGTDNRLLSDSAGTSYAYDANGNRSSKIQSGVTTNYTYDFENRLTQLSSNGTTIRHVYDGLGNRVARIENGIETRYVHDLSGSLSRILAETNALNAPSAYYVHGHGLAAQITPSNQRYAYHFDSRGSTVAISDPAEALVNRYAYAPFGRVADEQETISNAFEFAGRHGLLTDTDNSVYMRARHYDREVGRFLTRDPLGFESGEWNMYQYAGGNPLVRIDATGMAWSPVGAIASSVMTTPFLLWDYGQQVKNFGRQLSALSRGDVQAARKHSALAREHSAKVESHLRGIFFSSIVSLEGSRTATRVFGKTGALRWIDMRYRHGIVVKVGWAIGQEQLIDGAKDRVLEWVLPSSAEGE